MDLDVNVHGEVEVSDHMWKSANDRDLVRDMIVEKMTRQIHAALRESLARQLGAEVITPDDVSSVRDLLEGALRCDPLSVHSKVGEAYHRLRRIAAANEGRRRPI